MEGLRSVGHLQIASAERVGLDGSKALRFNRDIQRVIRLAHHGLLQ
jgi:hypothetical protein